MWGLTPIDCKPLAAKSSLMPSPRKSHCLTLVPFLSIFQTGSSNLFFEISSEIVKMKNMSKRRYFTMSLHISVRGIYLLTLEIAFADLGCIWVNLSSLVLPWHPFVCPSTKLDVHVQNASISQHSNQEIIFSPDLGDFEINSSSDWCKFH